MLDLFAALSRSLEEGRRAVLVTILSSTGSAPRGAGAWMLVSEGGRPLGTIGGGAVEYEAARLAEELLRSGESRRKRYVLTSGQAADLGMICGGQLEVLFQHVAPDRREELLPVLAEAAERTRARGKGVAGHDPGGRGLALGAVRRCRLPLPRRGGGGPSEGPGGPAVPV